MPKSDRNDRSLLAINCLPGLGSSFEQDAEKLAHVTSG